LSNIRRIEELFFCIDKENEKGQCGGYISQDYIKQKENLLREILHRGLQDV
tara:strand:+ start:1359 stop:1511 length:153 start_codon:yes stop_codon:yes gene_type:complete